MTDLVVSHQPEPTTPGPAAGEATAASTAGPAPEPSEAPAAAASAGAPGRRRFARPDLAILTLAASAAAAIWIGTAVVTAGHGFDPSDEGFYLLSYRWWSSNYRSFNGAQYVYGPVYQLLGYSIAGLRVFRVLTVLLTSAAFGWAVMGWLRLRRPKAPESRFWEAAGTAAIVACGGMAFSWLPSSPGYNDLSLLCALLAASVVLRMATHVDRGRAVPPWVAAALGPVILVMLVAKWASAMPTLALIVTVGSIAIASRGFRHFVRVAAWTLAGLVVFGLLVQFLVVPLTDAVPQMIQTNKLVAVATNAPGKLLGMYVRSSGELLRIIVTAHWVLLLAAVVAVVLGGRRVRWIAGVLAVLGLVLSGWRLVANGNLDGGDLYLGRFSVTIVLTVLLALIIGVGVVAGERISGSPASSLCTERRRGWAVIAMLALLPVTQSAGTGNAPYFMADNAYAAWAAIIIVVLTGIEAASPVTRGLAAATAAAAVALSPIIAADALWEHPYRTNGYRVTTTVPAGVPALASIRLDPVTAAQYSQFHARLKPYITPPGRAVMGFDEMAGMVLLLDGRSVGEAWYSAIDHSRTAAGIRAQCQDRRVPGDSRPPILIFSRPVTDIEIDVLRSCGLDFANDYGLLAPKEETMGLMVFVPKAEIAAGEGQ